ncbi:putative protein lunapark-b protein [Golovinomyces cichoracearum]|uniref:Endoplasmic reticulum junction formation protein lunapark n=1 Tax=Golovinomyces cichoracearum TaxID=62708 RepID=A0A420HYE9_9PEZI|nr:putative protein lunapark-b protein [Golovinomyces cichoracearum]
MVSLWPWKAEDNSPASFEKTLAVLTTKISKYQTHLDSLCSSSRRYKAIWTLYTVFLYIFGLAVLTLVVGLKNWTIWEGTVTAGFPVLIYLGRVVFTSYYGYRINTVTQRLEEQQKLRFETIEKLKVATKYNTTQELLEKYGCVKSLPKNSPTPQGLRTANNQPARTSLNPPNTANIPRSESKPQRDLRVESTNAKPPIRSAPLMPELYQEPVTLTTPGPPEFAPNAFSLTPEYAHNNKNIDEGHWYNRLLDVLLGEDETLPKNRLVLICQNCRLINGQAPPGTKSLSSLGKWRCYDCNSMNGEDEEEAKETKRSREEVKNPDLSLVDRKNVEKDEVYGRAEPTDAQKQVAVNKMETKLEERCTNA